MGKNNDKRRFIEDTLHRMIMVARLMVLEDGDTEEEVRKFVTEVGNKEFNSIFKAGEQEFLLMAVADMLKDGETLADILGEKGEEK